MKVPKRRHFDGWRHYDVKNTLFNRFWAIYQHLRYFNSINATFDGNFDLYSKGNKTRDTMEAFSSFKITLLWWVTPYWRQELLILTIFEPNSSICATLTILMPLLVVILLSILKKLCPKTLWKHFARSKMTSFLRVTS